MTHLPPIFAIFRPEQETFQLLQPELDEKGNCLRLKNWARPDIKGWRESSEDEQDDMIPWFRGQEWYVIPVEPSNKLHPIHVYTTQIHGKDYMWWSLRHKLVWSNFMTHHHRRTLLTEEWLKSPIVPILEFQTRQIYPRTNVSFYPRWCDCVPIELGIVSKQGWSKFQRLSKHHEIDDVSQLRIKTPPAKDEDTSDEEYSGLVAPKFKPIRFSLEDAPIPWNRVIGLVVILGISSLIIGLYVFILMSVFVG